MVIPVGFADTGWLLLLVALAAVSYLWLRWPTTRNAAATLETIPKGEIHQGFEQLHPVDSPDNTTIDVIAIHGLDTSAPGTWEHTERSKQGGEESTPINWLSHKDMLPKIVPQARIFTYNWRAEFSDNALDLTLRNHADGLLLDLLSMRQEKQASATRPVVFIASCFGGLVLIKALTIATSAAGQAYSFLRHATVGIVFLGTPFKGTRAQRLAQLLVAYEGLRGRQASDALVKDLDFSTGVLDDLVKQFAKDVKSSHYYLPLHCFYETVPTNLARKVLPPVLAKWSKGLATSVNLNTFLVNQDSATLHGWDATDLDCAHVMMNKFAVASNNFRRVSTVIKTFVSEAESILGRRNRGSMPMPHAALPFSRDPNFVNRGDVFDLMKQITSKLPRRVALVGLGGIGKSQLAIEFAYQISQYFPTDWVFWVHASTQQRVVESFREIADLVELPGREDSKADVFQLVSWWLRSKQPGTWWMILDSADDEDVLFGPSEITTDSNPIASYLPETSNGCIVLTTRSRKLATRLTGSLDNIIEIKGMSDEEAIRLLETKLGPLSDGDRHVASDLVRELDYVPLAIIQAAAFIQERAPRSSLGIYLKDFQMHKQKRLKLLKYEASDLRRYGGASNAVLTTWQVSFDHIYRQRRSAANLLSLMSFFHRQGIPESILRRSKRLRPVQQTQNVGSGVGSDEDPGNDWSDTDENHDDEFEEDVSILRNYCLIVVGQQGDVFEMHNLVQLSTKWWLEVQKRDEDFKEQYIMLMEEAFPDGEYESWQVCRTLFAHVEAAVEYKPSGESLQQTWAALLHFAGKYAFLQGRYSTAERMIQHTVETFKKTLGSNHESSLISASLLGRILQGKGEYEKSEQLQVQILDAQRTTLGADHPDTISSMEHLASTYWRQGRLDDAERLQVPVLEARKLHLGVEHHDTLASMGNLALTYWHQGRYADAEQLQIQLLEIRRTKLGTDHPDTLLSMANLASVYWSQRRLDDAERLQHQALDARKATLGGDHPDTLSSMGNLASTYRGLGRLDEAEKLQLETLEARKIVFGVDHPSTITSMGNLALTYWSQGRLDDAERLQREVLEVRMAKLGMDHPGTLTSMSNLAVTYQLQNRFDDAERLQMQAFEARKAKFGAHHPDTVASMEHLAAGYRDQGRFGDSEQLELNILEIRKHTLGEHHTDTLASMLHLALSYRQQDRFEEEERLLVQVLEAHKAKFGADHPDTIRSIGRLAANYWNQGYFDEAEKLEVQVLEAFKAMFGVDHPDTIASMDNLASTYRSLGRLAEAEALELQVVNIEKAKREASPS